MKQLPSPTFTPPPRLWEIGSERSSIELPQDLNAFKAVATIDPTLPAEGYRIEIQPASLTVTGGGPRALRYAWQHFQQWTQLSEIPCGLLEDAPDMERRGFMLDISRCKVPTRESLKTWVQLLSGFRYNEFQLYTEHTFAYKDHETVWKDASPMEASDILWLQDLCKDYDIELVPNQNCFGHFERWMKHDAYKKYAECPNGFVNPWGEVKKEGSVLIPDQASLDLVKGLLDEILPLFESPWVNIGCDETFELGQGASKARCEAEGAGKVYTDFVREIMEYVKEKHGKRCQFWGDVIIKTPEQLQNLPSDTLALEWGYEADHPFIEDSKRLAESGLEFMICPGTCSWRTFGGRTENMLQHIRKASLAGRQNGAKGLLLTDWGDHGHMQQSPVSYPALAWCALNAWNTGKAREEDIEDWCDAVAFNGNQGDTRCWMNAGRMHDLLERKSVNCSNIFHLFEDPDNVSKEVSVENVRKTLEAVENMPAPKSFSPEWQQTVRNMCLSLETTLKIKGQTPSPQLSDMLKAARDGHQDLWLQRNREGGLAESLEMYTEMTHKINAGEDV
ncbi:family 20 glycosylhydrolase [Kiritimatiellaeota bacterium B1221]|nr:family 20 glycosylhydrolase [Kiritimatiellaeota bacterium B1221]